MLNQRLYLLIAHLPADSDHRQESSLGRELLTRLARRHGIHCRKDDWSPRGAGPPRHPRLPATWYPALTHRHGRVVAGLATCPVGLDLEYHRSRHHRHMTGMIDALPESEVRAAIHASTAPQKTFYRAWTWHEALFKLETHYGASPTSVLHTRLARLDGHDRCGWLWQNDGWTLAVVSGEQGLHIQSLPFLAFRQYRRALDGLSMNAA
ncbi:4'-phosphopantetheinyl transferase superfamily protein [Aidingimonas halophila]|uniref:4'-phosphopantetheinyl transferase superfamily protein n=1 Tax=Aidingimonas halophila TaxID=574349 RepID=UPI00198D5A3B|nr:4'-phosphopantetheinyl transferase superfamily protein [Aidingimonas halophila]GHC18099.1 hypothetical protein GCM10008094_04800 [Aidingimonas halophila]